jgi:hypothetical protein
MIVNGKTVHLIACGEPTVTVEPVQGAFLVTVTYFPAIENEGISILVRDAQGVSALLWGLKHAATAEGIN